MAGYEGPRFYYQLGHQDQKRCLEMLKAGHGSGAILSPRDLRGPLLERYAGLYKGTGTELFIDGQLYRPSGFVQINPSTSLEITSTSDLKDELISYSIVEQALQQQHALDVSRFIVPAPQTDDLIYHTIPVIVDCGFEATFDALADHTARRVIKANICISGIEKLPAVIIGEQPTDVFARRLI